MLQSRCTKKELLERRDAIDMLHQTCLPPGSLVIFWQTRSNDIRNLLDRFRVRVADKPFLSALKNWVETSKLGKSFFESSRRRNSPQ